MIGGPDPIIVQDPGYGQAAPIVVGQDYQSAGIQYPVTSGAVFAAPAMTAMGVAPTYATGMSMGMGMGMGVGATYATGMSMAAPAMSYGGGQLVVAADPGPLVVAAQPEPQGAILVEAPPQQVAVAMPIPVRRRPVPRAGPPPAWVANQGEEYRQYVVEYYDRWYRNEIQQLRRQLEIAQEELRRPRVDPELMMELNEMRRVNAEMRNSIVEWETRFGSAEGEIRRLRGFEVQFRQKSEYLSVQLQRAQAEIARLAPFESNYGKATSELSYLQRVIEQLREQIGQAEGSYSKAVNDNQRLRGQLVTQESNIEEYSTEVQAYYTNANSEVISLKSRIEFLQASLQAAEAEMVSLREEVQRNAAYFTELQYVRTQFSEASSEMERLRVQLSEEIANANYLVGAVEQQREKALIAQDDARRLAEDRTLTLVSEDLAVAQQEIVRLSNAIAEYQLEVDRMRDISDKSYKHIAYLQQQAEDEGEYAYFGLEVADSYRVGNEAHPLGRLRVMNSWGPASHAGLRVGDMVTNIDSTPVTNLVEFNTTVSTVAPYSLVSIIFEREGNLMTCELQTRATANAPGRQAKASPKAIEAPAPIPPKAVPAPAAPIPPSPRQRAGSETLGASQGSTLNSTHTVGSQGVLNTNAAAPHTHAHTHTHVQPQVHQGHQPQSHVPQPHVGPSRKPVESSTVPAPRSPPGGSVTGTRTKRSLAARRGEESDRRAIMWKH